MVEVDVASVPVAVWVDGDGVFRVSISVDCMDGDSPLLRDDETLPIVVTINGETVFRG